MMSDGEIRMRFRDMAPGQDRIGILADLNDCSRDTIRPLIQEKCLHAKQEQSRFFELHSQGLTDQEIQNAVGCTIKAVRSWRDRNNLKPNMHRLIFDTALARRLYDQGKLDPDIARLVNVEKHIILKWRKRLGLPTNYNKHAERR